MQSFVKSLESLLFVCLLMPYWPYSYLLSILANYRVDRGYLSQILFQDFFIFCIQ